MSIYFLPVIFYLSLPGTGWLVLVSVGVVGLCVAGLALNILVRKNGKFPETEIAKNKNIRQLGITCVKQDEINRWKKSTQRNNTAADCIDCTMCAISRKS
ncbi:MAG: hypothetical protein LBG31_05810 [Prevotellaceae bacterium]|jgi:hypothetical protein|nr:hypothetical protein [Prevotellaceae bacterium]